MPDTTEQCEPVCDSADSERADVRTAGDLQSGLEVLHKAMADGAADHFRWITPRFTRAQAKALEQAALRAQPAPSLTAADVLVDLRLGLEEAIRILESVVGVLQKQGEVTAENALDAVIVALSTRLAAGHPHMQERADGQ